MRRRQSGAALLLVLAAIALLTVLAVELASRAGADSLRADRASRDGAHRRLVDSSSEIARGLVVEADSSLTTHWGQPWNREVRFTLGEGLGAVVRLGDESGKLNIARAMAPSQEAPLFRESFIRLCAYLSRHEPRDGRNWKEVQERILKRLASKEPLFTLDGLRDSGLETPEIFGPLGLSRYLTCFGDGRINLNTAPRAVLAALDPEFDDIMIDRIAAYRGKGEGEPGSYKWFAAPQDLMLVEGIVNRSVGADGTFRVDRNLYEKVRGRISVTSACISARIDSVAAGRARQAWVFFKPDGSRLALEELLP